MCLVVVVFCICIRIFGPLHRLPSSVFFVKRSEILDNLPFGSGCYYYCYDDNDDDDDDCNHSLRRYFFLFFFLSMLCL